MPTNPILANLNPADPDYASRVVDRLLAAAAAAKASDLHLQATADGLEARLRIDGVLQPLTVVPRALAPNVVARLKVLAELLTYRTDVPQEGRIRHVGRTAEQGAGSREQGPRLPAPTAPCLLRRRRNAGQHVSDALRRTRRGAVFRPRWAI